MPHSAAAAIVDLNEFRRRRRPAAAPQPAAAPRAMFPPVFVVWVPVWIVA